MIHMAISKPLAVVLLSGGMDSCVTTAIAAQDHRLALLHSSYGQRTQAREARAFEGIAGHYGVSLLLHIDQRYLNAIGGSALTDSSVAVPDADLVAAGHGVVPVTYVPFRNAHFLAAAASWAEVLGASRIFIGAVEQDSSGYPDCRPAYYNMTTRPNSASITGTAPSSRNR
jgi:7-cyano-7-deazaguanine synthase